jgi:hypothetical protein
MEVNRMKKLIVWAVAVCFVFSFSLAFAADEAKKDKGASPVEPVVKGKGGASSPTEGAVTSPGEPTKTRQEAKKARAAKKAKKDAGDQKDKGAKPVESVKKDKGGASNPTEAPAGSPGESSKSRQDVKKEKADK